MRIALNKQAEKWSAAGIAVALFLWGAVSVARTYAAHRLSEDLNAKNLRLASELDPSDSEYHMALGRLYEYGVVEGGTGRAVDEFRTAASLNPMDPQPWLQLGGTSALQGEPEMARQFLRRADALGPNLPDVQWTIGNFLLLNGSVEESFAHLRRVLSGTSKYDQAIFNLAWKASNDPNEIFNDLIPDKVSVEFIYLNFLLSRSQLDDAGMVWNRIKTSPEKFPLADTSGYMETLLQSRRAVEAFQVWGAMRSRGLIPDYRSNNLLYDGDFEDDLLNTGFGWRTSRLAGVQMGLDDTVYHSAGHSFLIEFDRTQNVDFHNLFQYTVVSPGHLYRLEGFIRTEGITTDSGPRLKVEDQYHPANLSLQTAGFTGTTQGWTHVNLEFNAGPGTSLIRVSVVRQPSLKLDNLIGGKFWLDDLSLTDEGTAQPRLRASQGSPDPANGARFNQF